MSSGTTVSHVGIYKSGKMAGPWETPQGLLTGTYWSSAPDFPQRLGDRGPLFRYLPEQSVPWVPLSFLRQTLSWGLGSPQGRGLELLEATLMF